AGADARRAASPHVRPPQSARGMEVGGAACRHALHSLARSGRARARCHARARLARGCADVESVIGNPSSVPVPHASVPILKVDHLTYRYPNGRTALADISFSVGMNEVVGLVGPNGAGKTTLLLHLNGLLAGSRARTEPGDPAHAVEVL